jgi:hypothetical protein
VDTGWATVLSAVVAGSFGLLTVFIQKLKKENSKDHAVVMGMLKMVYRAQNRTEDKVSKIGDSLAEHIQTHGESHKTEV